MNNADKLPPMPLSHHQTNSSNKKVKSSLVVNLANNNSSSNGGSNICKQENFTTNRAPSGRAPNLDSRISNHSSLSFNGINNAVTVLKQNKLLRNRSSSSTDSSPVCIAQTERSFSTRINDSFDEHDLWFSATNSLASLHDCHEPTPESQIVAVSGSRRRRQRIVPIRLKLDDCDKSGRLPGSCKSSNSSNKIIKTPQSAPPLIDSVDIKTKEDYPDVATSDVDHKQLSTINWKENLINCKTKLLSQSCTDFFDETPKNCIFYQQQEQRTRDRSQDESQSDAYLTDCSEDSTHLYQRQTTSTKRGRKTIITKQSHEIIGQRNNNNKSQTNLIVNESPRIVEIFNDNPNDKNNELTVSVGRRDSSDSENQHISYNNTSEIFASKQQQHKQLSASITSLNQIIKSPSFNNVITNKQESSINNTVSGSYVTRQSFSNSSSSSSNLQQLRKQATAMLSINSTNSTARRNQSSISSSSSRQLLSDATSQSASSSNALANTIDITPELMDSGTVATSHLSSIRRLSTSSTASTSSTTSTARILNHHHHQQQQQQQQKFKSSATFMLGAHHSSSASSLARSTNQQQQQHAISMSRSNQQQRKQSIFLDPDTIISPDVRSLVKEIGMDFEELEQASNQQALRSSANFSMQQQMNNGLSILFNNRPIMSQNRLSIMPSRTVPIRAASGQSVSVKQLRHNEFGDDDDDTPSPIISSPDLEGFITSASSMRHRKSTGNERRISLEIDDEDSSSNSRQQSNARMDKINQLLANGNSKLIESIVPSHVSIEPVKQSDTDTVGSTTVVADKKVDTTDSDDKLARSKNEQTSDSNNMQIESNKQQQLDKAVMFKSMSRIEQRMCDLCKKLKDCQDTKEAIDLLNIMINMIEKAWSVHSCGYDLGFKLCNTLREAGGLDILLNCIHDYGDQSLLDPDHTHWTSLLLNNSGADKQIAQHNDIISASQPQQQQHIDTIDETSPLTEQDNENDETKTTIKRDNGDSNNTISHSNSTVVDTTDDSCSANTDSTGKRAQESAKSPSHYHHHRQANHLQLKILTPAINDETGNNAGTGSSCGDVRSPLVATTDYHRQLTLSSSPSTNVTTTPLVSTDNDGDNRIAKIASDVANLNDLDERREDEDEAVSLHEDVVYLSARLLSQCLTSENRRYIVANGLQLIIKLACNFTTMKSTHSHRWLNRSASLLAKQQTEKQWKQQDNSNNNNRLKKNQQSSDGVVNVKASDMHAKIGTEILEHLFKHSEDTCSEIISLGGLQAVLYGCRSQDIDTLRHCASALANLAMYGGPDSQQTMIEQKAHVWLFRLAVTKDDNIQYYACLAIVVLVANPEIEADVLKSGTLDLVEPFVTRHEPQKFATSTTSHIHGQSASWLRKLIPVLDSKREEARNLAAFHFNMEAYIKKAQGQTEVFKTIGSVEALKKVASSPIAIASKFACQTLRLIGEEVPHKLSQQVPLWTVDDVMEWVKQIGFERFSQAFIDSNVDGDLLLQLDEQMLQTDLRLDNGIIRRRFLRELGALKRIADYSSCDTSNLYNILTSVGQEYTQYIYNMVQNGVTRDNIHLLSDEQLLNECKIYNSIHRMKITQAIKAKNVTNSEGTQLDGDPINNKTLDVFVSYRRSTGSQLASLLKVHLQLRGFSVFIDVERLEAGKFDNNLLESIKIARNFILVLSPNALDRCLGDDDCKDWVHKEIVAALTSNCNIIPIFDNFQWPETESLPQDMRSINYFNGVRWIHDYQDACVDKVERFIRGEISSYQSGVAGPRPGVAYSSILTPSCSASISSLTSNTTRFDQSDHPLSVNNLSASPTYQNTSPSYIVRR